MTLLFFFLMSMSNGKADIKSQAIAFARKKYLMTKGIISYSAAKKKEYI